MHETEENLSDVAVIGMAAKFPKSPDIHAYWENLISGKELISFFTREELLEEGISPSEIDHANYIKAKSYLEKLQYFDHDFFDYKENEASYIDPQHRFLLICAWEALEHAGYDPTQFPGAIGVFAGCNNNTYFLNHVLPQLQQKKDSMHHELVILTGNSVDYLTTRLSYKLNLKGPSKAVQTACSTSLVAINDAYQSLLNYECDMALAGGVSISLPCKQGYFYSQDGIYSPDGHCKAFDQAASGTCFGDGVGVVLLKRVEDALRDRDTIHAVIKGSAVNNDGSNKMAFFAPSIEGQAKVIASALAQSAIHPETITYIEAHGTGTQLGDVIEVAALKHAFSKYTDKKQYCAMGSVKTNIGHTISAAGVAGFIKTVLSIKNQQIPPSLHYNTPNEKIGIEETPFYINRSPKQWSSPNGILRAGVSSFGIGGTNAHVIIESPPTLSTSTSEWGNYLLPLSASHPIALKKLTENLYAHCDKSTSPLIDTAFTLQTGRKPLPYRCFFIGRNREEILSEMKKNLCEKKLPKRCAPKDNKIPFSFAISPSQFNKSILSSHVLPPFFETILKPHKEEIEEMINMTVEALFLEETSSPTLMRIKCFVFQYLIAKGLINCGIEPSDVLGCSWSKLLGATLFNLFPLRFSLTLLTHWDHAEKISISLEKYFQESKPSPTQDFFLKEEAYQAKYWEQILTQKKIPSNTSPSIKFDVLTQSLQKSSDGKAVHSLNNETSLELAFLRSLGVLWRHGLTIEWNQLYKHSTPAKASLPTYPFQGKKCWLEYGQLKTSDPHSLIEEKSHELKEQSASLSEKIIALIWSEVLDIKQLSINDDFYELGGDSLAAIEIVQEINKNLSIQLSLNSFHTHRTVKQMAHRIAEEIKNRSRPKILEPI